MSISVGGLVSGLDTNGIIDQLLELQQRPIIKLQQQEAAYQVKLTVYGSLQGLLNSMKSAAQALDAASDLAGFSTSSGDAALFTSSADSSAATGTHNVTVKQLAREHMVKSAAFTGTEEILEFKIDANNKFIDFTENTGGGASAEIAATLTEGSYTVSELETHIKTQLEAASDGAPSANNIDYTVSYDSTTKKFTIQENGSSLTQLDLRWATGANSANSASSLLGFDAADDTGAVTYTSDNEVGEGTIHLEIGSTFTIGSTNNKINFLEVGGLGTELTATLDNGTYTISELMAEIKEELDDATGSDATYTVTYDNSTQKFTIAGAGGSVTEIQYLWTTGDSGNSIASTIGFTANDTGALSYTADDTKGTVNDITISATDTIEDVADAINDADAGVQAAVIFDGTNYYLTLSAEDSGAANVINLTVTDIDGDNADTNGLSRLAYREGGTTNLTQTQDALDSLIHVDGVTDIARSTNTIDDVIEGVTITLTDVHAIPASESDTLTVSRNTSTAVSKINSFVSAYNNVLDFFETYQGYDEDTKIAGSLQGDGTTNQIRNHLRRLIRQDITGVNTFSRLSDLGIILNDEGRLEVNSTTLNDALDDHFDDVIQFFAQSTTGSEGFGVRMVDTLDGILDSTDGTLAARTDGIQTSIDGIEDQVERIEMRNLAWESRTRAQFNSLELLLAEYQNTGNYLSQQILGMQNMNNYISRR